MRRALIAAVLASTQLTGCFVFIPGSVVGAVTDSITGDRGEHCVPRGAVVGQRISLGYGRVGVVEYVSKTPSSRCPDPMMPMRAALAFPAGIDTTTTFVPAPPKVEIPAESSDTWPLFGSLTEPNETVCHYGKDKAEKTIKMGAGQKCPPFIAK